MLTRRCAERHRWLTPGAQLNQLFLYLFAVGARRFGLQVHALVVMSTHYHAVVTDPLGVVPAFEQWLHSLLARSVNWLRGRTDTFWDGRHGGRLEVVDSRALGEALVYVWNNPTQAGLVRRGKDWPGVRTTPHNMLAGVGSQKPMVVQRPGEFFDGAGAMPETVELALVVPAMLLDDTLWAGGAASAEPALTADAGPDAGTAPGADAAPKPNTAAATAAVRLKKLAGRIVAKLNELVREAEDRVAEKLAEGGRRFVGARSVLRQSPDVRSKKPERHGSKLTRIPLFLASSREARDELLAKLRHWRARYDEARRSLRAYLARMASGEAPDLALFEDREEMKPPLFPWGTYQLRLRLAVPCHPPPG